MKTVCAWCGVVIKPETPESELQGVISHGLCKTCKFHLVAERGMPLRQYLDGLGSPIVVVDGDVTVTMANQPACDLLKKDLSTIEGFRPGNVFECAYSYLPEGCGQTIHCSGCAIRRSVTETLNSGRGVTRKPAFIRCRPAEGGQKTDLLISTELVAGVVLLRIDEAQTSCSSAC
jgi:hypothetical protein